MDTEYTSQQWSETCQSRVVSIHVIMYEVPPGRIHEVSMHTIWGNKVSRVPAVRANLECHIGMNRAFCAEPSRPVVGTFQSKKVRYGTLIRLYSI